MFCATYPPPPGSAPGYHDAHQLSASRPAREIAGSAHTAWTFTGHNERIASADPKVTPAGEPDGGAAPTRDFIASIPPTAWTDTIASTIAPPISKRYWMPWFAATPQ